MSRSIRIAIAALALVALAVPQIAERLRVPLGTVKTRTFYALRALRAELEERGSRWLIGRFRTTSPRCSRARCQATSRACAGAPGGRGSHSSRSRSSPLRLWR